MVTKVTDWVRDFEIGSSGAKHKPQKFEAIAALYALGHGDEIAIVSDNYVFTNADKGKSIVYSGTGLNAFTPTAAPSSFDDDFWIRCVNTKARAVRCTSFGGYTDFFLWPRQIMTVFKFNGGWYLDKPVYWRIESATDFYVDPAGNSASDGLDIASPRDDILTTWNLIRDRTIGPAGIKLTPGSVYPAVDELVGDVSCGFGRLVPITGDPTLVNPAQIVSTVNGEAAVKLRDGGWTTLDGILVGAGVGINANGVQVEQGALADCKNMLVGSLGVGSGFNTGDGGNINITGLVKTAAGVAGSLYRNDGGKLLIGTVVTDFQNLGMSFSNAVILGTGQSKISIGVGATFINDTGLGGKKFDLSRHSILEHGAVVLKGSASGTADATSTEY